jgi:uncharacterized cupredoxin-like copper-binding protein
MPSIRRQPVKSLVTGMVTALAAATAVAGCGSSGGGTTAASPSSAPASGSGSGSVSVKEADFSLTPSNVTVKKAGTITITATNAGQTTHALEVQGQGTEKKTGDIAPGSSGKLTVTLKAGKYEWYCPIDGHKQLGMKGTITVGGGGSSSSSGTTTTTGNSGGGSQTSTGSSSNYGY